MNDIRKDITYLIKSLNIYYSGLKREPELFTYYEPNGTYRVRNFHNLDELMSKISFEGKNYCNMIKKNLSELYRIVKENPQSSKIIAEEFNKCEHLPFIVDCEPNQFTMAYITEHYLDYKISSENSTQNIKFSVLNAISNYNSSEALIESGMLKVQVKYINDLAEVIVKKFHYINRDNAIYFKYLPYFCISESNEENYSALEKYKYLIKSWNFNENLNLLDKLKYLNGIHLPCEFFSNQGKIEDIEPTVFNETVSYFEKVSSPATLRNYFLITKLLKYRNNENNDAMDYLFNLLMDQDFPIEIDPYFFIKRHYGFKPIISILMEDKCFCEKMLNFSKVTSPNNMDNSFNRLARICGFNNPIKRHFVIRGVKDFEENLISEFTAGKVNYLLEISDSFDFESCCLFMQLPDMTNHKHFLNTFISLEKEKKQAIITAVLNRNENDDRFLLFLAQTNFEELTDDKYSTALCLLFFQKIYGINLSKDIEKLLGVLGKSLMKPFFEHIIKQSQKRYTQEDILEMLCNEISKGQKK